LTSFAISSFASSILLAQHLANVIYLLADILDDFVHAFDILAGTFKVHYDLFADDNEIIKQVRGFVQP